ncbi:MAG: cupin domain-containing protein [Gammaproteobacteria bacterium]|nr:cupin domain-containing protein [Gammaproteobacteria bacterium]
MTDLLEPASTVNSEHYVWGDVCDGWHLLRHSEMSVVQERVPPGASEVKHFHARARQFFYVLSGTASMEFDGCSVSFSAGQGIHVPPGVAHRFYNASPVDVIFLVISVPIAAGDRTLVS